MDDDPFSRCYELENDGAKVLNKAALAALTNQVCIRFESAVQAAQVPAERLADQQGLRPPALG